MRVFVGIDGGGTKTEALAVDEMGEMVGKAESGPMNPNTTPDWKETLHSLYQQLSLPEEADVQVFAGVSGAGTMEVSEMVALACEGLFGNSIEIQPDVLNALYSGVLGEPGVVQICGTGSITYGMNEKGEHKRVGGWGYLFGDRGSGYEIGRRGMLACLENEEGLAFSTLLTQAIHKKFGEENGRDILQKIYEAPSPKSMISPLSEGVMQAAEKGDEVAWNILYEEALAVCSHIMRVEKELFPAEKAPVVLTGGVVDQENPFREMLKEQLDRKGVEIVIPRFTPVEGALYGAIRNEHDTIKKKVSATIGGSVWPRQPED